MSKLLFLGLFLCACNQQPPPKSGARSTSISVCSEDGKTCCEGTPAECAAQLQAAAARVATAQQPLAEREGTDTATAETEEICGGECDTRCRRGQHCCGPCSSCAEFCKALGGATDF